MSAPVYLTALAALAAVIPACSPALDEPAAPRPVTEEGRYGLLVMSHDDGETGVAVSGQLAAWTGERRAGVLHALALPEMAWLVSEPQDDGQCCVATAPTTAWADGREAHIELLGAGELVVTPPGGLGLDDALHLQPREFPRLFFSIGGVVYDADAPQALPFHAGGTYKVSAPGDEVGPLEASIEAPAAVRLLTHRLTSEGLEVLWAGTGPVFLTLSRDAGPEIGGVQCRAPAGGRFEVPASLLAEFGPGEAQLSVAAVARRSVNVAGLSAADLFFVSRDQGVVRLPEEPDAE